MQNTSRGSHINYEAGKGHRKSLESLHTKESERPRGRSGAIIASGKMQGERGEGVGGPCVGGHAGTRVVRTQSNR